ncbi:MAG TPA: hypothetical protein VH396_09200, partial [Chitinophagaceae bacterium]
MSIDLKQLEINVNFHSLQPGFLNSELHYIIASDENTFQFAKWDETPQTNEQKFYCFLMKKELFIPAGNITLKESYVLQEKPIYPLLSCCEDFISAIEKIKQNRTTKYIRRFSDEDVDTLKNNLQEKYQDVETHIVTSHEAQHRLFVVNDIEISISDTMVYF